MDWIDVLAGDLPQVRSEVREEIQLKVQENETVYKIDYSDVAVKPEAAFNLLKRLVGERGFEPPTPWSRTRWLTLPIHRR